MGAPAAGQETGLRIRRYFTTEGVHPYDEIQWDVRDAVIQNFRTGEVAFEQKGVEVPKAWSQNATNIAAQKYFRGTQGTPQRERSVKQMIDRVVGRYHEEGIERGYFADDDEAAIFRDELTHLLVTQKAAFNSPVWFNVGWRPKGEEQVSACQPYYALVSTPAGLVPIGKLVEDDAVGTKVLSADGPTTIVATKANGVKEVLRIHTKAGYTLDVTPDHLVWRRAAEGRGEFVPAGDLRPGDALEWHRSYAYGETELNPGDVAEAALAGWLQSDGYEDRTRFVEKPDEEFVERWGLRARGDEMRVPERLFTAPLPVVVGYLKSIFDGKGFVSGIDHDVVAIEASSEQLMRGIQRLLLRFGIFARVARKGDPRADRKGCWSVRIQTAGDRAAFAAEIGFVDRAKAAKLEASLSLPGQPSRGTKQLEIARIESLGEMEVYDIQTDSGEYLSDNLRVHNCFILSVEDEMDSILNWYAEEGRIFKHGSGAGINLSTIRSSKERLRSGGTASGPVSFMRGADASAGTIKSGGATRRAAKMVVLNVGHPDIRDFIWCKALEENKARALRDAGFDMDLDGKDSHSIQYQNANNSVRVDDDFMQAVVDDRDYELKAVTTGETIEKVKARALMREIAEAAWQCADPGVQYDTTINDWHTCPNSGRINASNPCSEYLHVDDSSCNLASLNLLKFVDSGGNFDIDAFKHAVEVVFLAQEISVGFASYPTEAIAENSRTFRQLGQGYANLGALLMTQGMPYDSDEGRAWAGAITALMTGHCYATSAKIAERIGAFEAYAENEAPMLRVMEKHRSAAYEISDEHAPAELLTAARAAWDQALELGRVNGYRNAQATVLAPTGCLVGGTLVPTERGLVRLGSLGDPEGEQWQDLGVNVNTDDGPRNATKFYVNGVEAVVTVETKRGYRIKGTPKHRIKVVDESGAWVWKRFAELEKGDRVPLSRRQLIGEAQNVPLPGNAEGSSGGAELPREMSPELAELAGYALSHLVHVTHEGLVFNVSPTDFDSADRIAHLGKVLFGIEAECDRERVTLRSDALGRWWQECGFAHSDRIPDAVLATNDPETYSSCAEGLRDKESVETRWMTASEELSVELQVLLLARGYDTIRYQEGELWVISAPSFEEGESVLDEVASAELGDEECTFDLSVPDNVTYLANGFVSHNTIGLLMDCDTTGIEPDLALKKTKKLVGGGTMSIVNLSVPRALTKLGYTHSQIADIVAHIDENSHVVGAPHLSDEHLSVFDTAMGERSINYMGHIKMMAAAQPFLSGAISKTVNLPEDVTVEDVEQVYLEGWRLGLKAIALYRDNCKAAQPLSITKKEKVAVEQSKVTNVPQPVRRRLPKKRASKTIKFRVADTEGYLTVGEFPDGSVGEMFLKVAKQGSTLAGIMDAFAISISMGLQYGVPLSAYVKQFVNTRFEPSGMTDDPDFRIATSILDYVFRVLALDYLPPEERHGLGIRSAGERQDEIEAKLDNAPAEHGNGTTNGNGNGKPDAAPGVVVLGPVADASVGSQPFCGTCGVQMLPAGSCFACPSCGSTSGCS